MRKLRKRYEKEKKEWRKNGEEPGKIETYLYSSAEVRLLWGWQGVYSFDGEWQVTLRLRAR